MAGGIYTTMLPDADSFSQALYTFDIGQNDLTAGYFANKTVEQVGTADVPEIISQFKNAVTVGLCFILCSSDCFCLKGNHHRCVFFFFW